MKLCCRELLAGMVILGLVGGAIVASPQDADAAATALKRSESGAHAGYFFVAAEINGQKVRVRVDTGASASALSYEDAKQIGLKPDKLNFDIPVSTEGGVVRASGVNLDKVEIDGVAVSDVPGLVMPEGSIQYSTLGMSFLMKFQRYEIDDNVLYLKNSARAQTPKLTDVPESATSSGYSDACVKLGVAVFNKKPSEELKALREACESDPDDCPPSKLLLSLGDNPFPVNCYAADKLRLAKEQAEEQARIAREAPYDMSPEDILKAQTALIECHDVQIGLPDGKLGRKTLAAIARYTGDKPLNKDRFDSLVAGCPDRQYTFAAGSIGTDGEYSAVFGFNSGVEALRASIDACRKRSANPNSCISMLAPTKTAGFISADDEAINKKWKSGIAIAECNKGKRKHVFLQRGPHKDTAKAFIYDSFAAEGFKRSECKILALVDAFGVDD